MSELTIGTRHRSIRGTYEVDNGEYHEFTRVFMSNPQ